MSDVEAEEITETVPETVPIVEVAGNSVEYDVIDGIKIYTGASKDIREHHERNIAYLKKLTESYEPLFTDLVPSTLTAQGLMSNVQFDEKEAISMLSPPKGQIMLIGCNYGELYNTKYKPPETVRKSGRGRKPKPKPKNKRKTQGTGKYFSSQITFLIQHPTSGVNYKIKLFRNGVFQVPGVKDPSMSDLIAPITILRDYLSYNFGEDVQVLNFMAVMRNYKVKLRDERLRVDLEELERYLNSIKKIVHMKDFLAYTLSSVNPKARLKLMKHIGKTNAMNIAEITYNTDRCFSLIIKYYRPMTADKDKKTTVKLLKRGKINFDGGNSKYEVEELYYWLLYIYNKLKSEILIDVGNIKNTYVESEVANLDPDTFIFDTEEPDEDNNQDDNQEDNGCCNDDNPEDEPEDNIEDNQEDDQEDNQEDDTEDHLKKPVKLSAKQLIDRANKKQTDQDAGELILKTLSK
jgi:hypothetical protein